MEDLAYLTWEVSIPSLTVLQILYNFIKRHVEIFKERREFWENHFKEIIEKDTQCVYGTKKVRTLPDFTKKAAGRTIIPSFENILKEKFKRISLKYSPEIQMKRDVNHIIHGGPVTSNLSEQALREHKTSINFGYIDKTGNKIFDVKQDEYNKPNYVKDEEWEVKSREWIIVDKDSSNTLVEPKSKKDGTYEVDGAIVMKCKDPYSSLDGRQTLAFMGTHAPGSYASDAIVRVPCWIKKFDSKLHKANIHTEPFIAALEIKFERYEWGSTPDDNKIHDIEIKKIEKLQ